MAEMKFYTEEEAVDKVLGSKGTPARDQYEKDINDFMIGEAIRKARTAKKLTQEQLEKKKEYIQKIQAIVMEYVKVDSNSMEFTMKKQEFLKTGLPKSVYKKIKKEMKMNNCFLKENNIKNLEVSW